MTRFPPLLATLGLLLGGCVGVDSGDDTAASATAGSSGASMTAGGSASGSSAQAGSGALGGDAVAAGGAAVGDSAGGSSAGTPSTDRAGAGGEASSTGGTVGSAGAAGTPAVSIDYSMWQLQLPTGTLDKADIIAPKDLPKYGPTPYFFVAKDSGRMFMDPQQGANTGGSDHCRTELREFTPGGQPAAWSSTGTNTLTVTGKVTMLSGGNKGLTAIGQVFVDGLNTLAELQYNGSEMSLFYEEEKGKPIPVTTTVPVPINTQYQFVLSLSNGVLSVTVNGKQLYLHPPSKPVLANNFYFKVGNYDQNAVVAFPPSTAPWTQVEVYSVAVVHQ